MATKNQPKQAPPTCEAARMAQLVDARMRLDRIDQARMLELLEQIKSSVQAICNEIPPKPEEPPVCEDCHYCVLDRPKSSSKCSHPAVRKEERDALISRDSMPYCSIARMGHKQCKESGVLFSAKSTSSAGVAPPTEKKRRFLGIFGRKP